MQLTQINVTMESQNILRFLAKFEWYLSEKHWEANPPQRVELICKKEKWWSISQKSQKGSFK